MKAKSGRVLLAAALLTAVLIIAFRSRSITNNTLSKAQTYITVDEAKAQAFQSSDPLLINNLKGIYMLKNTSLAKNVVLLEDEEPGFMEDVPLYCVFNDESITYLKDIEPGSELMISGMLLRKGNSVELYDCKLNCINKGTILKEDFY